MLSFFHTFIIIVCYNGSVRLRNQTSFFDGRGYTSQGRVDVCLNGTYLPICDLGWDSRDAQVVCNQFFGSSYGMFKLR